jgi:hypothetical protein
MRKSRVFVASLFLVFAMTGAAGAVMRSVKANRTGPSPVARNDHRPEAAEGHGSASLGSTGLTGLANAIAHVQANLQAHPNSGLANALEHLQANLAAGHGRGSEHGSAGAGQDHKSVHSGGVDDSS